MRLKVSPHDPPRMSYLDRWRGLGRPAWLYLLHVALLTGSLAIVGLLFNLAILSLGYSRSFLGVLNTLSLLVAAILSLPLWWLATRVGLRMALIVSALLQAASAFTFALWPSTLPLLGASALGGMAAVLFEVSSPPFMMRYSDTTSRDHLFSANASINTSVAGIGSLVGGQLPALLGFYLGVAAESPLTYRAAFAIAGCGIVLALIPLLLVHESDARIETPATRSLSPQLTAHSYQLPNHASRLAKLLQPLIQRLPIAWRDLIQHPKPLLQLLIAPLMISFGAALLIPYLNIFFKERFTLDDGTLGAIFAALGISTGVLALIGPLLSSRIGKIRTVVLTQVLSIPFLLVLGFVPILGIAVGAALVRAALFNMASPLYGAFAMERTTAPARPAVIGLINGAYSVGYLIGPFISTLVQERYGFSPLFFATTGCYSLAILANYWLSTRAEQLQIGNS